MSRCAPVSLPSKGNQATTFSQGSTDFQLTSKPLSRSWAGFSRVSLAEPQDLQKQLAQGLQVAATQLTDAAVVRLLVGREHPEAQILVAGPLDPAGGDGAHAVGVEQQHRHHPRVKPLLAAGILGLGRDHDRRQIQLVDQIEQEINLMVSGQPVSR